MSAPRVSVVMPVRNEARFVEAAVRSLLDGTYADFELLVIDDGSDDETPRILAGLAAEDARVVVNRVNGAGLVAALNDGIDRARGEYVARMDGDDLSLPDRLARQVSELDRRPALGVVGTQVRYVDSSGARLSVWKLPVGSELVRWSLAFGTALAHPSVMMRRAVLPRIPYRSEAPHAEDYDLWVRLAGRTELDNLSEVLLERRVHGVSVSDLNAEAQVEATRVVQQRAIVSIAGRGAADADLRALSDPRSLSDRLRAGRLIIRLYRASHARAAVRRDAMRRLVAVARTARAPR